MAVLFKLPSAITAAGLLSATLLVACGTGGADPTATAGAAPAAGACDEREVREAIVASGASVPEIEVTYLKCVAGFGWATIRSAARPDLEAATVFLRVSGDHIEVLNLGTSVCSAEVGIPADIAEQIAPPGANPAGDCPTPVQAEPSFTG